MDRTYCIYVNATKCILYIPSKAMRGPRGGTGGPDPLPLKNHKNIGFLSNTGPDPLNNYKASKPAFNVEPSSLRQRNAILNGESLITDAISTEINWP